MKLIKALVIVVSLVPFCAQAAEFDRETADKKRFKNAEKIMAFLGTAGIYSDTIKDVAYFVDERSDDGYFRFADEKMGSTRMQFQYEMKSPKTENFQIKFTNEEMPNWELNANPRGFMLEYKLEFN